MTEGELKKRIAPIIDKAKKEFPDDGAVNIKTNPEREIARTWEELVNNYIILTEKRNKWFKKWFGDST